MQRLVVGCLLVGCGRLDFGALPVTDAAAIDPDTTSDAPTGPPCPTSTVTADPLPFGGKTYRYTNFDNAHAALPGVAVTLFDATGNTPLGAPVTSNSSGDYSAGIPSAPRSVRIVYELAGWFTSIVVTDQVIDTPTAGTNANLWVLGDAPLWNSLGMVTVYDTVGEMRNDSNGTMNIAIRTCAGESIAGVKVQIDPPPSAISYTTNDNMPSRTETQLPHSHVVVFNATAGINRITATAPGLVFPTLEVDVVAGQTNTLVLLRPYE